MANKKISQLTAKGSPIAPTDLVEIAEDDGFGNYSSKSVSGLQPILVSGLDIKTINLASILGSGNLSLQDTLVSGTNIKTINSTSLLGSGDLVIGSGVHILTKPVSGRTYSARTSGTYGSSGGSLPANVIQLYPFIPANSLTISNLQINVNTAVVGGLARIIIYSDSNGVPTTKLLESTSLDCSTTGVKTYTASFTFTAGTVYWLGCYSNLNLTNVDKFQSEQALPISTSNFTTPFTLLTASATFPTAPSTLGTATLSTLTGVIINLTAA
jgi:hypothetical protein